MMIWLTSRASLTRETCIETTIGLKLNLASQVCMAQAEEEGSYHSESNVDQAATISPAEGPP